jgi:4-hydroxybenzoate polyprenyltransferase
MLGLIGDESMQDLSALILNDYFDRDIDKIHAPERPLPSGIVTDREVIVPSIVVTLLGMIASALLGTPAPLVTIGVWVVGVAYNWRFKRTGLLGNLMVSFSAGMTFIFGGITPGTAILGTSTPRAASGGLEILLWTASTGLRQPSPGPRPIIHERNRLPARHPDRRIPR